MTPPIAEAPLLAFWRTYGLALLLAFASLLAVRPPTRNCASTFPAPAPPNTRWPSPISPWTMPTVAPWPR